MFQSQLLISKSEVEAENGMVTASHPLAAEVGIRILQEGGNAADAAVATAFTLAVVEPFACGLGGSACAITYHALENKTLAFDGSIQVPHSVSAEILSSHGESQAAGKPTQQPRTGYRSIGVPGMVKLLARLHRELGRLPWADLIRPAIDLAEGGFVPDWYVFAHLAAGRERLWPFPEALRIFYHADRTPIPFPVSHDTSIAPRHERLFQRDLATSLIEIANNGESAFYQGEIGHSLATYISDNSGFISESDLADYRVRVIEPLWITYRGRPVSVFPPPGAGATIAQLLNTLEQHDLADLGFGQPESVGLIAAAQRLAMVNRQANLGDPDFKSGELAANYPLTGSASHPEWGTHFNVIDRERNVVSLTASLGSEFGSGVVVPGTGIVLNNYLSQFELEPDRINTLGPGRRALHAISPLLMFDGDRPVLALGSAGGEVGMTALHQIVNNIVDFDMGIQAAVAAPRLHVEPETILIDQRMSPEIFHHFEQMGESVVSRTEHFLSAYFGSPNGIALDRNAGLLAGGVEPYGISTAVGY